MACEVEIDRCNSSSSEFSSGYIVSVKQHPEGHMGACVVVLHRTASAMGCDGTKMETAVSEDGL